MFGLVTKNPEKYVKERFDLTEIGIKAGEISQSQNKEDSSQSFKQKQVTINIEDSEKKSKTKKSSSRALSKKKQKKDGSKSSSSRRPEGEEESGLKTDPSLDGLTASEEEHDIYKPARHSKKLK